jgi:hypothetical protein
MAYNPFDDVIENDPAYKMQIGGVQPMIIPQQRPDYTQETFKPFATAIARGYKLLTPEQETLDQIEKDQQLRSLATTQAFQGTEFDEFAGAFDLPSEVLTNRKAMDLLDQAGFKREGFTEGLSRIGKFFYGNQRKAFEKLRDGQELTSDDRLSIALAPLDSLDFLLPPVAIKKLAGIGLKNVNSILRSTSDLPEVQQVKQFFGGSPVPAIGGRAEGPPGMVTEPRITLAKEDGTGGGARLTKEGVKSREDNTQQLIDILKQDLDENKTKSIGQIIKDNNLEGLLKTERGKGFELKKEVKQKIKTEIPEIFQSKFAIRAQPAAELKRAETDPKLIQALEKFVKDGTTFNSPYALSQRLDALGIATRRAITKRLNDPNFKTFFDILIQPKPKKTKTTDSFDKVFRQVPETNIINILSTPNAPMITVKDFNPQGFDLIKELRVSQGITGEFSPKELFKDFLEFRYRNVKDSGQFPDLTPEKFFNRKYDAEEVTKIREEFKNFISLEQTRLTMQKETRDFLEELSQIPEYKKYLLDSKGQLDLKLVKVDKAHDTPLFLTRVEGAGRLKNVGRFLDQGTEPEFINPSFQAYNNLQKITDPLINKLADLRVNKTLRNQAEKMDFSLSKKTKTKSGKYVVPKDRLDFVSEDMIKYLNLKGANINLDNFKNGNQLDFLNAVDKAIDKIYKDRAIRTLVPVREGKGGKKLSVFFGVEDMKAIPNEARVELFKKSLKDQLDFAVENNLDVGEFKNLNEKKGDIGFIKRLNKGGISMVKGGVQMAIGGQNFTENMNRQDFTPDPAIDGDSAFQQAVQSGNLQALNLPKIFKGLGEAFGVFTPKKVGKPLTGEMSAVSPVAKSDFPLQSFTLEKINNLNIQSARPQDWINELQGGAPAPKNELLDSGLFQYLADFEKYFPNQKVSKDKLVEFLEDNPISNLKIRIKGSETGDPAYDSYMGKPRHKNVGSARMDKAGEDYREVVIEAGTLPGQQTGDEFVNSSHFSEKNVLAFGRVGTYKNSAGDNVAVIQEMQTDYITQVRKEQELLNAEIEKLNLQKTKAEQRLERAESPYDIQRANESLAEVNSKLPALLKLQESKLIKPYPNVAAADKIPEFNKQLQDLQKQINNLSMQGVRRENPEFLMQISNLEEQQKQVLNQLLDLNRANEYEMLAKDVKVPDIDDRDNLLRYINGSDSYVGMKNVKTFPPTPLNNQADYVDAILKAVIKDAENRGINRITIMPADIGANARWGKESEDAKRKFRNLYDKVGFQRLKDIAKKYGGTIEEEFVVDSTKGSLGLRFLNKDVDGNFQVLKETDIDPSVTIRREDLGPSKPPEGLNAFLNEEILRVAKDYGPNEVVFRREIAPGQTMEYFVNVKQGDVVDQKFDLVPLGDADRAENATIVIEEYNPQLVKMNVLVLPDSNKDKPMYLFKKKKGGIMPDDRLVSITDIYGDY